ncbi:MAG: DUF1302 family protein, partial [bacterium]
SPTDAWQELSWPDVQITGASVNYWESHLDVVIRSELAWFWNEPVFIPEENLKLSDTNIPLPPALLDLVSELAGTDMAAMGLSSIALNPTGGTIPEKDILRYMIGMDKQIWLRPLNRTSTFLVSLQYFGQWVPDYDSRMRQPILLYPSTSNFAGLRRHEHVVTAVLNTMYRKGTLQPQMAVAYDVRGAWLLSPAINFIWEPFRFGLQYSAIEGNFTNFGAFRDRDQITFLISYLLD